MSFTANSENNLRHQKTKNETMFRLFLYSYLITYLVLYLVLYTGCHLRSLIFFCVSCSELTLYVNFAGIDTQHNHEILGKSHLLQPSFSPY